MPAEKSISFRSHLLSNTTDLLADVDLHCARTAKLIVSIVSKLAAYTEEGIPLSPTVFICNSVSELIRRAGVGEHIPLSRHVNSEIAAEQILKSAAPLCSHNWRIYVERSASGEHCDYGIFCGSNDPAALTIDEIVLDGYDSGFPIVRIAQSVTNKVEVRTNKGSGIEFRFNDDVDVSDLKNRSRIRDLSKTVASGVGAQSEAFVGFVERLLATAVRESHGTLIAVLSKKQKSLPEELKDAIILDPPLDLFERYKLHMDEGKTAISVSRLQVASELLGGFVRSDGITLLSVTGQVLGYRAFIRTAAPENLATGGARTRAFAGLAALVGAGLEAAFFRSEDGRMEIKLATEDPGNA